MGILQEYFNRDPNWSYATKMEIAAQIGMTPNQVSKWNWDQRKKLGMPTDRKKKKWERQKHYYFIRPINLNLENVWILTFCWPKNKKFILVFIGNFGHF